MNERHKLFRKPWISLIIYPVFAVIVFGVIFALFHIGAGGSPLGAFLSVLFGLGLGLMNEMMPECTGQRP